METMVSENPRVEDFLLERNGFFPNSDLPVLVYRDAVQTEGDASLSAMFRQLFRNNNWGNNWVDSIFDYHHYHSNTHEVLGISEGSVKVQLGGPGFDIHELHAGDVLIIPAGVAHKRIHSSDDFSCVGGYPGGQDYDMNYGKEDEFKKATQNIRDVPLPETDPVYGKKGKIFLLWKKSNSSSQLI